MRLDQHLRTMGLVASSPRSSLPHIFISGPPRSGTTLLKSILLAHPELAGGDYESTGILKWRRLDQWKCGEIPAERSQVLLRRSRSMSGFYDQVAGEMLRIYGGSRFVDKIWPSRGRLALARWWFPRATWVVLLRDGRDCYLSARSHPNIPQTESVEAFARYWRHCVRVTRSLPDPFVIRYEDLVQEPEMWVARLFQALGLTCTPAEILRHRVDRMSTSMASRPVHRLLGEAITAARVERWRSEMGLADRRKFEAIAAGELQACGYGVQA